MEYFYNSNGITYKILKGGIGQRTLLERKDKINDYGDYVVCLILEKYFWWQGSYFKTYEEAKEYYEEGRI